MIPIPGLVHVPEAADALRRGIAAGLQSLLVMNVQDELGAHDGCARRNLVELGLNKTAAPGRVLGEEMVLLSLAAAAEIRVPAPAHLPGFVAPLEENRLRPRAAVDPVLPRLRVGAALRGPLDGQLRFEMRLVHPGEPCEPAFHHEIHEQAIGRPLELHGGKVEVVGGCPGERRLIPGGGQDGRNHDARQKSETTDGFHDFAAGVRGLQ
jgi:hypothetical protein